MSAPSTRGVRACIRRVAGCATPSGSAGHADATANLKLTFHLDHSAGADHFLHEEHSDLNFSISDRAGGNISGPTPRVQTIASEPLTGLCNLKSTVRREQFNFRQEQIADRVQFLDLLCLSAGPIGYN